MTTEYQTMPYNGSGWDVFRCFKDEPNAVLLESSLHDPQLGRYSFIAFRPFQIFAGDHPAALSGLRISFRRYATLVDPPGDLTLTPFSGGIIGFLSYDFGLSFEKVTAPGCPAPVPGCCFGFYDTVITVDHFLRRIVIAANGLPETSTAARRQKVRARIQEISEKLAGCGPGTQEPTEKELPAISPVFLKSNFSHKQYLAAVEKALAYICRGDIYQVNLAQCFSSLGPALPEHLDALTVYGRMREHFPSCFGAYFDGGDFQIASHSPERFLRLTNGHVTTRPMKGTRPRAENAAEDARLKAELLNSAKERAELLMVTDLERNDLGRVCQPGSVKVAALRTLEEYKSVFQTTASVEGQLAKDKDGFDLLYACLPGGSVTGCPKIRAMQIISELEPTRRSVYTGALGYMDFGGDMDFNILIRSVLFEGGRVSFHVGGGIVADSNPHAEYEETLVKAQAMLQSLGGVVVE